MAFGPPKYMPGQIKSQSLGPVGFDETMAMLNATAPSPIQAPKDRGMFGRFMGILAGGKYGDEQMGWVERLGRGADGMNAIRDEQRMLKRQQEEEVKRREMAEQLGMYDGQAALFAMDPTLALGERRDQRNFDRSVLESDRNYGLQQDQFGLQKDQFGWQKETDARDFGLQQDQFGLEKNKFGWQQGTDARDFAEGVRQFDLTYGLSRDKAAADAEAGGTYGLNVVWGMDAQGNYVPMQAGKSGGLIASQMPEGVTPLGPYGTAFDSATGKEQAKRAAYESTAGQALTGFEAKADELVSQIDQAIEMSDFWNTGVTGNAIWSPDFNAILDSIGAKAMLSELISIKSQGGTFGALSDSEGKALRDAAVNITKSQSEAQLDKNLKAYRDQVEKTRANMRKAFEDEYVNNSPGRRPPQSGNAQAPPAALTGGLETASDDDLFNILGGR